VRNKSTLVSNSHPAAADRASNISIGIYVAIHLICNSNTYVHRCSPNSICLLGSKPPQPTGSGAVTHRDIFGLVFGPKYASVR
jgi:hypothetical protein